MSPVASTTPSAWHAATPPTSTSSSPRSTATSAPARPIRASSCAGFSLDRSPDRKPAVGRGTRRFMPSATPWAVVNPGSVGVRALPSVRHGLDGERRPHAVAHPAGSDDSRRQARRLDAADQVAPEPLRRLLRQRGDDDLVEVPVAHRRFDGLERVRASDESFDLPSCGWPQTPLCRLQRPVGCLAVGDVRNEQGELAGTGFGARPTSSIRRCVDAVRFATMRTRVTCADSIGCSLLARLDVVTTLSPPDAQRKRLVLVEVPAAGPPDAASRRLGRALRAPVHGGAPQRLATGGLDPRPASAHHLPVDVDRPAREVGRQPPRAVRAGVSWVGGEADAATRELAAPALHHESERSALAACREPHCADAPRRPR